ncbi:hypothetical protein GCM10020001_024330 [Nonomuraea salmonea]
MRNATVSQAGAGGRGAFEPGPPFKKHSHGRSSLSLPAATTSRAKTSISGAPSTPWTSGTGMTWSRKTMPGRRGIPQDLQRSAVRDRMTGFPCYNGPHTEPRQDGALIIHPTYRRRGSTG